MEIVDCTVPNNDELHFSKSFEDFTSCPLSLASHGF